MLSQPFANIVVLLHNGKTSLLSDDFLASIAATLHCSWERQIILICNSRNLTFNRQTTLMQLYCNVYNEYFSKAAILQTSGTLWHLSPSVNTGVWSLRIFSECLCFVYFTLCCEVGCWQFLHCQVNTKYTFSTQTAPSRQINRDLCLNFGQGGTKSSKLLKNRGASFKIICRERGRKILCL